jgi:hypothetical protein
MRSRDRVIRSLENVYREAFQEAKQREDAEQMARLDLEYQRNQLQLEVLLDIRELLDAPEEEEKTSLLDKAQKLKGLTKLRMP